MTSVVLPVAVGGTQEPHAGVACTTLSRNFGHAHPKRAVAGHL